MAEPSPEAAAAQPPEARPIEGRRSSLASPGFEALGRQARRLQRFVFVVVALVALAPPTAYSLLELRGLRGRSEEHVRHAAHIAQVCALRGRVSLDCLRDGFEQEGSGHGLGWVGAHDLSGLTVVRVGSERATLTGPVRAALPAAAAPLGFVEVGPQEAGLYANIARVFAIHILVGLAIGLSVYRLPTRALERAIRELEETHERMVHMDKLAAFGEMYAGLTHELNNPLGIILARVRMLRADAAAKGLDQEASQDLEVIERHATRIGDIVRGLLAFARKEEFESRECDLSGVVRGALALVERPFAKHGIEFELDLAERLPPLLASPTHLEHVFVNLLTNARDAMPQGGRLRVRTFAAGAQLVAEVADSGTGIAASARERLFEPFFTTKGVGKGTGLGLSVSYGIVRAHGGDLVALDAAGGGAVFRVTLPASKAGHVRTEGEHPGRR